MIAHTYHNKESAVLGSYGCRYLFTRRAGILELAPVNMHPRIAVLPESMRNLPGPLFARLTATGLALRGSLLRVVVAGIGLPAAAT